MLLRQVNAPWGSGKNVLALTDVVGMVEMVVEMVEKRGKSVDSRSSLSTHPCHHFLLVFLGQLRAWASVFPTAKKKIWTEMPLKFL